MREIGPMSHFTFTTLDNISDTGVKLAQVNCCVMVAR